MKEKYLKGKSSNFFFLVKENYSIPEVFKTIKELRKICCLSFQSLSERWKARDVS